MILLGIIGPYQLTLLIVPGIVIFLAGFLIGKGVCYKKGRNDSEFYK